MSPATPDSPDPGRCPLCGQANGCAMAAGCGTPADPACWCVTATFPPALLQRLSPQAQGKACICQACVEAASRQR